LILDFKENLRLGGGPRETNQMFYRMEQCSVLGFCLIHKSADGVVHKDYFDFFSSILSHDSLFAKDCLCNLVTDPSFPRLTSLSIWTDCGPHFHSFEFAHAVLRELPERLSIPVQWSFFGEHHGKSVVDGHFGLLSRWLKEGEKSRPVENMQSCIDLMREKLHGSNALKPDDDKLSVQFRIYDRAERSARMTQWRLPRFSDYYSFTSTHQSGGWTIHGFTTSERVDGTILDGKAASQPDTRKTKRPPRKEVTPAEQDDLTASQKRKLDLRKRYFSKQDVDALAILLSRLHL
jgi:hypothetical protein